MRIIHLAYFLFLVGIIFLILAVASGEASIALFIIFPVIYGSGWLSVLGTFLIMIGIFLMFLSPFYHYTRMEQSYPEAPYYESTPSETYIPTSEDLEEKKTKIGGVVLIGPIPIVFGSDKNMAMLSVIIAILMLISIGIIFLFFYG